ncbi:membrane protein [Flavobacterium noncentrifugens]|uniref:Urease accessory protein UreH-like transmembrane domain-containing protein n=1 Tax=Flavobacterium noncentrifugens TaxID=1128970 RepID=A0A1G8XYA0_9FLAO|nr:sulfite exporter TauE/SafE family protein [Flavobacterium noncentrifugens]GEP52236.1 membrane protein [Flavobacterium noncentrifugens]SDJ95549.1 hypothetical protein SAMN04487935_2115 [Flavobacterium noncentrifugens]
MLYAAFILGLLSSLHCIGMCGPIAMMLPLERNNPVKKALQIFTYHSGRILTYASIGLLFGCIGKGFYLAGIQQRLSIFMGIAILAVVLVPEKSFSKYNFSKPVFKTIAVVRSALGKRLKNKNLSSIFLIGLLNGFLPCGMVYAALFGAVAMQNPFSGTLYMVAFGLGTIPLMSAVVYFHSVLSMPFRNKIHKIIPYTVACIGILFILRGLGLGIPYVSPSETSLFVMAAPNCK